MTITLRIENFDQLPDGGPVQYQTSQRSFDIGREAHLDWSLPDPNRVISGRHCEVRFEKGSYWLFDVSRNGTFLNNAGARMKSPHQLQSGDRLQIGHYLIAVTVQEAAYAEAEEMPAPAPAAADSIWDLGGPTPAPVDRRAFMPAQKSSQRAPDFAEQYIDLPDMRPQSPPPMESPFAPPPVQPAARPAPDYAPPPPFAESPFGGMPQPAPIQARPAPIAMPPAAPEAFMPPRPRPAEPAPMADPAMYQPAPPPYQPMPQAYAPQGPLPPVQHSLPPIQPAPQQAAPPPQASPSRLLQALAAGAGVSPDTFDQRNPEEVAHEIGAVLKIALEQLSVLLKARAAAKVMTKSSNRTMISADHNNPLKFIPGTQEMIEVMFARRRPGYLGAERSVEEAFADLKSHEIATFSAMQKALAKLLDGLSPQSIEAKLPSSAFSSKKSRAWDVFVERWDSKTDPYENGMLDVFLAYFAEAYDEAVRKR